jgi:hypothetical protein
MNGASPGRGIIALSAAAVAAAVVYFLFDPLKAGFFPPCPFHLLTGLYCPGCGTQRALHALLHGHLAAAAGYNLLSVAALPVVGYGLVTEAADRLRKRPRGGNFLYRPWFSRAVLVAVVVFWILRNLPFPGCRWLAP